MPEDNMMLEDDEITETVALDNSNAAAKFERPLPALEFICAGNSAFTLLSEKSGNKYSYRVKKAKHSTEDHPPLFVYIMNGRAKLQAYDHIGTIFTSPTDLSFVWERVFQPRRSMVMLPALHAFQYAFNALRVCKMPVNCQIWQSGRCGRCNRILTNPASILTGFGEECFQYTEKYKRTHIPLVRTIHHT
jgi:hypothetical protein